MQVFLDDIAIEVDQPTLAAALRAGVQRAQGLGRLVVEVQGDGRVLGQEALVSPSKERDEYGEVRIMTASPGLLVRSTLSDATEALVLVEADQAEAAGQIQRGELVEARKTLERAVQTWQAIMTALAHSAELLSLDLGKMTVGEGGPSVGMCINQLIEQLKAMVVALSREDWSTLADSLEFDMAEQARTWKGVLACVMASVQAEEA